jgi:PAS domain S-box-containing protein
VEAAATTLAVALLYVLAGKAGLSFAFFHASATPVWPPTGIALAVLLVLGSRLWPAIFLGAFLVNISTEGNVATSLGIALGNTLEAVTGAHLVNRYAGGRAAFDRPQGIFRFALLAALCSTAVSATIGVTTLALGSFARWGDFGSIWLTWWLGDAAGDLIVAPFLLLWIRQLGLGPLRERWIEAAVLAMSVVAVSLTVFTPVSPIGHLNLPIAFLCIPPFLWTAFRFGPREASTSLIIGTAIAVVGTLHGGGPFARGSANESLILLQAFMGTMALTMLPMAALGLERREADHAVRRSEQQLRLALDAARMGTWEWIVDTGEVRWSQSLEALHGLPAGGFRGTYDAVLAEIHPDDRERVGAATLASLGRGLHHVEYRIVRPDGAIRWVEGRGEVLYDDAGRPERMLGVCLDITERKTAEEQRAHLLSQEQSARRRAEEAERHNAQLLAREALARSEAEAGSRAKDEFLAMLGHELRNPLGAISNAVHVLARLGSADAPFDRARDIIERQVRHLSRLVDDLLDVSRALTGKIVLKKQPLDLSELAARVMGTLHASGRTGQHRMSLDAERVEVDADAVRLEQVVTNLLENAVKYTPAGGAISVVVRRDDGAALLGVQDTGVGIPPPLLPRVFDLFVQGDHTLDRTAGGLGIGLTLVRRIVEMHGGSVEATSPGLGLGSCFTVRLPLSEVGSR